MHGHKGALGRQQMQYKHLELNISEWLRPEAGEGALLSPLLLFVDYLGQLGGHSLEEQIKAAIKSFTAQEIDQKTLFEKHQKSPRPHQPPFYTTLVKYHDAFIFLDIEPGLLPSPQTKKDPRQATFLEIDIFSHHSASLERLVHELAEGTMKCFGLTGAKSEILVDDVVAQSRLTQKIKEQLTFSDSLSLSLYEKIRERVDRELLIGLKRRGSILEKDIQEILPRGVPIDKGHAALDFFSGSDIGLVNRKYAVVCNKTGEIIFLLSTKEGMGHAHSLQCPKCARPIGEEILLAYYEVTPALKDLIDGSRWMPLLVRESLAKAGVAKDDVLLEVKLGEDQLDVIGVYFDNVFVIELKDRPATLNDAYKLSAKTSRLEAVMMREAQMGGHRRIVPAELRFNSGTLAKFEEFEFLDSGIANSGRINWVPVLVSTNEIAKDAKDLLRDTRPASRLLESCESGLDEFFVSMVSEVNDSRARRRFSTLISPETADSVTNLSRRLLQEALLSWFNGTASPS